MNRKIVIHKAKSSLYIAASVTVIFSMLAILFAVYSGRTGGMRNGAFWFFVIAALLGWYMIADYARDVMIVSDEGIRTKNLLGNTVFVPMKEIRMIGKKKNFFFVYGENNRILAAMEAELSEYADACELFQSHGIQIAERDFRSRTK